MNTKNVLVSFLAIASLLILVATVSAAVSVDGNLINTNQSYDLKVDGNSILDSTGAQTVFPAVIAGDSVSVKVTFVALNDDTDVTLKANLEGQKDSADATSPVFDVEAGKTYSETVTVKVPFELKDQISDDLTLSIVLDGKEYRTEIEDMTVRVQRPSYNPEIKSVTIDQTVRAGSTFPVDLVLKNMGYNNLDDLYVTVSIPSLNLEKSTYFGDLVTLENCSNDCKEDDTISGRLFLTVPYDVKPGVYTVNVEVKNDDTDMSATKQLTVTNSFVDNVVVSSTSQTVKAGENAVYSFLIVNPTDQVQVYRIVSESATGLSTSVSESLVAVSAGSSKTVEVTANAQNAGDFTFNVNVLSGEQVVKTIPFTLKTDAKGASAIDPIVILTVVLAVVFLVLLIVLIVLISKKPQKTEEFGESYY